MTDQQHPITPPLELYGRWYDESPYDDELGLVEHVATQAAQWGSDQELEACCEWLDQNCEWLDQNTGRWDLLAELRAARRSKLPSLKEQALGALHAIATGADDTREFYQDIETIKTALESLPK